MNKMLKNKRINTQNLESSWMCNLKKYVIIGVLGIVLFNNSDLFAQTQWTKVDSVAPILTMGAPGRWDDRYLTESCLIFDEIANEYKMWYSAHQWGVTGMRIGLATSTDLVTWEKDEINNPVLEPGSSGSPDDRHAFDPSVIYEDGIYKMWYTGQSNSLVWSCMYATSPDGITWTTDYNINPVLEAGDPGEWDTFVGYNVVVKVDTTYFMWYSGSTSSSNNQIGVATSTDGVNFFKHVDNPVIDPGFVWDIVIYPEAVVYDGEIFHMWYGGEGAAIAATGYAWSEDGLNWTKADSINPVLEPGGAGDWDNLSAWPSAVILMDATYHMIYENNNLNDIGQFGYAYSSDIDTTLIAPSIPQGLSATPSNELVILLWDSNPENNIVQYYVYRDTVSPAITLIDSVSSNLMTIYRDTNVVNQTYYYRISAVNIFGLESDLSDEVTATPTLAIGEEGLLPTVFRIHQNYPNPFNPTTTIRYELPQLSDVQITIFDIQGRQVKTLVSETQQAGYKSVILDATHIPSGTYFYQIKAGRFNQTKKMILLK